MLAMTGIFGSSLRGIGLLVLVTELRHCEEAIADVACRERSRTAIQGLGHQGVIGRRDPGKATRLHRFARNDD